MEGIGTEIAKNEAQSLVNFVKDQAKYLCCFSSYATTFDQKKEVVEAKLLDVNGKIEKARGVSCVTYEAWQWTREARSRIDSDTRKEKCFNDLCLNCWRQYQKGKDLAEKIQQIDNLLGRSNFDIEAGAADLPGIKYHSLPNFMHFESRKSTFQDLKKALEDEDCNMIGLQGLGGTGKTSMAIQVGADLEGSKKFDKVMFLVVSQTPDFKKVRYDLAKQLDLKLEKGKEVEHSEKIWSRISNMKEKVLIVLDDVWEQLNLQKDLGIPTSHQHKGCTVLITTRNVYVCTSMRCQKHIQIQTLSHKDALDLFLAHASITDTYHGLKGVAEKLVKRCEGVPVAIVTIAKALKNQSPYVWKDALKTLEKHDVNQRLEEAYKCLKLSYDYLKNEKSQQIFLISSLFPEDFEIPKQLLSKIAIGLGLFGEVESYHSRESKAHEAIKDLVDSSLFLTTNNEERVKIHDLVREVALWIGEKDIQWVTNFETRIKENLRYLTWKNDSFPNEFDGKKLEILMIFLSGSKDLKVPDTFFEEMTRLKVLYLSSDDGKISTPTLLYSLQSLKNIHTLNLLNLRLGDISLVGNLPRLECLSLVDCSIIELPKEILKLKKLRLLEVKECEIEMNNPFEVIERCSQLEELSFFGNWFHGQNACAVSEKLCLDSSLQRYKISQWNVKSIYEMYGFISRWFYDPCDLRNLITEEAFKQFVRMSEFLKLGGYEEIGWKNLIPDIVPMEDGGMDDLIVLCLYSWPDIQCLVDSKKHETDETAFSNIVELELREMDNIEDLYRGCLPSGFLEQLKIMRLSHCQKLRNIFFDGLRPCLLKVMRLVECPKWMSIFPLVIAQSLTLLEELTIQNCDSLEHILELGDDIDEKSFESLFPKLKNLEVEGCGRLKTGLPIVGGGLALSLEKIRICKCEQLSYFFDKVKKEDRIMLPSLKEIILRENHRRGTTSLSMQRPSSPPVARKKTAPIIFSWAQVFFSCHKSSEETNVTLCNDGVPDHTIPEGSLASMRLFDTSEIITRELFNVGHIKKLELSHMSSNSESLFTLSMASLILWEELTIEECDGLKHLITMEANDYNKDQMMSCHSVFPRLEKLKIIKCKDLEFLFPSTVSIRVENLKRLIVNNAPELKYVVEKYHHVEDHSSNQNHNGDLHFELPALEFIYLKDVPKLISIFVMNYSLAWPSLKDVTLENHNIESFTNDLLVCSEGQLNKKPMKELDASIYVMPPIQVTRCLSIQSLNNVKEMRLLNVLNSKTLLTLPMASMVLWEKLTIERCEQLEYIVADEEDVGALMNNHRPIFPKLKELVILECHALEYLFAPYTLRSPSHLKYMSIKNASKLKYVFGTSHHENQNIQTCIDFPALEELALKSLPELISICPKNYYLRGVSLKSFDLLETPEFDIRSLTDFMVRAFGGQPDYSTHAEDMKMRLRSLESVHFCESKIEEIFDLTHMDKQKIGEGHEQLTSTLRWLCLQDLSELKNICVGPKCILSLNNILELHIRGCNKLKVIFSNSVLKSLPKLWRLKISSCEELTHITEENADDNDHLCHEPCFPVLSYLIVERCNKLKYLFSITISGIPPKLKFLNIEASSILEHVFIRRDETKEMVMMDVLPKIGFLYLNQLSSLVSVCNEVDFRALDLEKSSKVYDCPQFSFYERKIPQVQDGPKFVDPQFQVETEEKISSHINMSEVEENQQSSTISSKDWLDGKGAKNKGIMMDLQQSVIGTPNITKDDELLGKEKKNEKTRMNLQQPTNGTSKWRKTSKQAGYSDITEGLDSEKIETTNQLTGSESINTMPTTNVSFSEDTSSKDELVGKDEKKETIVMDPHSLPKTRIVEERPEENISTETIHSSSSASQEKIPIPVSPNLDVLSVGGITSKTIEILELEEQQECGFTTTRSQINDMKAKDSSSGKEHETSLQGDPFFVPTLPTSPKQIPSYVPSKSTHGRNILRDVESTKQPSHEAVDTIQDYGMAPSFYDTNYASSVPGVQEIVDMMKLEGIEPSMIAEAFKTHPQLRLSSENRSTKLLCFSYRVLLNILNIMAIRTPFTITEAEKKLLVEYLNDASAVGFDKDWLESVRIKVFHCDVSDIPRIQQDLEELGNKLHTRKTELAIAQKELEAAQEEHASARMHHSQLLHECQEILEQRDQCWKTIAAKFRPFGF